MSAKCWIGSKFTSPPYWPCRKPSAVSLGRSKTPRITVEADGYTKEGMQQPYDLWYDVNAVGADLVVETWISHGPQRENASFNPQPGDRVMVGDDEEAPLPARVIKRLENRVWVQVDLWPAIEAVA